MKKYENLKKEAEKSLEDERLNKIKEQFKVLLNKKKTLLNNLKSVKIELVKLEEEGLIKATEVKGGGVASYTWVGIDSNTTTNSTALSIEM